MSLLSPREFPAGLSPLAERVAEIRRSVEAGAHEIDVVITRAHVFGGRWHALYDEIAAFKQACGPAHMKVILGTGDLLTLRNVARASVVAMMAGADFIKTSTGKEPTNATFASGVRHDPRHPRVRAANRNGGGIQTRWRNSNRQAVSRLALHDERGTRIVVGASGNVPLRRQQFVRRYRAATGAPRHRTLLSGASPSAGLAAKDVAKEDTHEHCRKIRHHGVRSRSRGPERGRWLAGSPRAKVWALH